jgi:hypothetical protein
MTQELHSTLDASGIVWPAIRIHIPCMAHLIQLALSAIINSLRVNGHTKSWESHERNPRFGKNECTDTSNSQRLRKDGNAKINKVSDMQSGLAKIIKNVRFSRHLQSPETDIHITESTGCIDYITIWLRKRVL